MGIDFILTNLKAAGEIAGQSMFCFLEDQNI